MYNMQRAAVRRIVEADPRAFEELSTRIAETREHKRVKQELRAYAIEAGFAEEWDVWDESEPDVLRWDRERSALFVGDSKNADVETATRKDTIHRIEHYFEVVDFLFKKRLIERVVFVVGTNDPAVTDGWERKLTELAVQYSLIYRDGTPLVFNTEELKPGSTWLIRH